MNISVLLLQFALFAGVVPMPPTPAPPQPAPLPMEQPLWQVWNVNSNEELIALIIQEVNSKGIDQVILELNSKLTLAQMKKLFEILNHEEYTDSLAQSLWQFIEQKEKIESVPLCGDPRVVMVAKSKEMPTEFWMGLSDGSFWKVAADHLGADDPFLQKILINSLLGNYIHKADATFFEVLRFPGCEFSGFMNVEQMKQGVILEGKDVYFLGHGGFVK